MENKVRKYMAMIGRRGGRKSRRKLDAYTARVAVNKVLALVGRNEARDFVDILHVHENGLSLGALCWAAASATHRVKASSWSPAPMTPATRSLTMADR